jgi:3-hydroxyisobutyrate dehydrogenase-like beta-hydroxyacid dehydrogenase
MSKIGILHPGEMGISIAAAALNNNHEVYWASQGRSARTRARAEKHGLIEIGSFHELCQTCDIIISVCPPHAAKDVAQSVKETGFQGLYLDANAISPRRSKHIGQLMESAGIRFVDGGIIGGPAWTPKETWLYLSGTFAYEVASCFSNGFLETRIIGTEIGKASALKMCYAAYSKGTTALLAATLATAETFRVLENLYEQWDIDQEGFSAQVNQRVGRVTTKAWRFEGEMKEIAATFREAGLPSGFHEASAEVYSRMAGFKDAIDTPPIDEVITSLFTK